MENRSQFIDQLIDDCIARKKRGEALDLARYDLTDLELQNVRVAYEGYQLLEKLLESYPKEWFTEWVQERVLSGIKTHSIG